MSYSIFDKIFGAICGKSVTMNKTLMLYTMSKKFQNQGFISSIYEQQHEPTKSMVKRFYDLEKTNKYLFARINVLENNQNTGEKGEVLSLLELFHLNQMHEFNKLTDIFGEEASEGISILNMDTDDEIVDITQLSKAPSDYKADCKIRMKKTNNVYSTSIKCKNGANPSILNHTPRSAKIFQEGGLFHDHVSYLDTILEEYIYKRNSKIICEDTPISKLMCLKDPSLKEKFFKILAHFVFDGTGKGYSKCKSDAIMTYRSNEISFEKYDTIQKKIKYIESIYDQIVISLRDKGMPKVLNAYCKPWVFYEIKPDGSIKHKGSLHVRMT
jgi:hypothetical protein